MSVDRGYGMSPETSKRKADAIFKRVGVQWRAALLDDGWNDAMRFFNAGGYGLILVDAKGIVRGVNLRERQVVELMSQVYPDVPKFDPKAKPVSE